MSEKVDVVIVGAGLSGLACARYLLNKSADLKVVILEARDRVGGRTYSVPLKTQDGATERFDLGAHWVSRSQPHIMALVEEFGLKTHQQNISGRKFLQLGRDHAVKTYTSDIPTLNLLGLLDLDRAMKKIDSLASEINQNDPYKHKRGQELDSITLESFIQTNMWMADAKELIRIAVLSVMGVELGEISALYFFTYVNGAGGLKYLLEATPYCAQEYTLENGTQQISEKLAEALGEGRIKLSEPVSKVMQDKDSITVTTSNGNTYTGSKLVVTVPPSLIGRIVFEPAIPTAKCELHKKSFMANYHKVLVTYKKAFWQEAGSSGESVTNGGPSPPGTGCSVGPLCTTLDDTTLKGNPAIVAFIAGNQAVEWRQEEPETRKSAVLTCLGQFFGEKVHDYVDYIEKDWDSEYYTGGVISCVSPGGMRYYADGLRRPFGNVHMAGTETATIWPGYMSGAVQSGQRAAIEILQSLRPHSVSEADITRNNTPYRP